MQSLNPPVEAPTSRHTLPLRSICQCSRAFSSLRPPRLTYRRSSPSRRSVAVESMDAPALSTFCSLTRTFPASMSACARSRDGVRPRSTSNLSRRVFNGPLDLHSPWITKVGSVSSGVSKHPIRRDAVSTPDSADCRSDSLTEGYRSKTLLFHKLFHGDVENSG